MLFYLSMLLLFAFGAIISGQAMRSAQPVGAAGVGFAPASATDLKRNPLFLLAVGYAIVVVGFRDRVGVDWANYVGIFRSISYRDFGQAILKTDPAYAFVNWLALQFGAGIWFVNVVCAILLCWGIYSFARTQPNPWLVFVVAIPYLLIVIGMNYVRQSVAIGMCLAAIGALIERSLWKFLLYMALGALFHKTALIALPVVALGYAQNNLARGLVIMAGLGIGYMSLYNSSEYDRFSELYLKSNMISSGAVTRLAMNIPPALLMLIMPNAFRFDEVEKRIWKTFSWLALVAAMIGITVTATTAVDRLALYLIPLQLAILGRVANAFSPKFTPSPLINGAVIVYSAVVEIVFLTYSDYARYWLPYRSFLS